MCRTIPPRCCICTEYRLDDGRTLSAGWECFQGLGEGRQLPPQVDGGRGSAGGLFGSDDDPPVGYVCGAHRTFGVMPATAGVTFHGREKSGRGVEVSGAGQFSRQLGEPFGTTALCCDGIAEQPTAAPSRCERSAICTGLAQPLPFRVISCRA